MHLHHDAVAAAEGVVDVGHAKVHRRHHTGHKGLGFFKAVAELAAHGLTAKQLLVAAHLHAGRGHVIGAPAGTADAGVASAPTTAPTTTPAGLGRRGCRVVGRVHVNELDHPVAVGAGGGHKQPWLQRAHHRQVIFQRLGLVDQHVGPRGGKTLVAHHKFRRHIQRGIRHKRHGSCRVAQVLVEGRSGHRLGCIKTQFATGLKVQRAGLRLLRRPGRVAAPDVGAGLKHVGLGQFGIWPDTGFGAGFGGRVVFAAQVLLEEREQHVLAVVLGRGCAEADVADARAVQPGPAAVRPRAHHQQVHSAGVETVNGCESTQRALRVFGVVPAAHRHHRGAHVLQVRRNVALLPVIVQVGVRYLLNKIGALLGLQALRDVAQRAQLQEVVVSAGVAELEFIDFGFGGGVGLRREEGIEAVIGRQHERAVVVRVVVHVQVYHRRLR